MSTSSIGTGVGSTPGAPINITGLGSGLDTSSIISALLSVERLPVTHMTNQQTTLTAQQSQLRSFQSSLQSLAFSAAELSSPSLFKSSQTVSSSEPTRVSATTSAGAGVGGHEVEVKQLANSAQRTFSFTSPTSADTITIDGHATEVPAGSTIQSFVNSINSDSKATVYAAALENGSVVFSSRETGNTGASFIQVSDPGATLVEQAGLAKEGKNAEYSVDGVTGTAKSNTIANAIPGVTLSLNSLTTTGPVTINVAAPAPSTVAITEQVQSFVKLYNSTIGAIQAQLTTKPPTNPQNASEFGTGTLFGDSDLESLLNNMRQSVYTPGSGLPSEMSSLANIGISTGGPTSGGSFSQSAVSGALTINSTELASALQANPTGVKQMLQSWSSTFQNILNADAQPGGTIEARINGDSAQVSELGQQITTMNEMIALRQQALQQQYTTLESVMSQNQAQASWLASQTFPAIEG
jgi:flagellar hook-associated protein 2